MESELNALKKCNSNRIIPTTALTHKHMYMNKHKHTHTLGIILIDFSLFYYLKSGFVSHGIHY